MNDYKLECLMHCNAPELPEKWDNESNFIVGIGLIKRYSGKKDYAIVKLNIDRKPIVIKDFGQGGIVDILEVYPCQFREKTAMEKNYEVKDIKTKTDCIAFLTAAKYEITDEVKKMNYPQLMKLIKTII